MRRCLTTRLVLAGGQSKTGASVRICGQSRRGGSVQQKADGGLQSQKYNRFMDFAAVFYTTSLVKYTSGIQTDGEIGHQWYSLLVQLTVSQFTFELVSGTSPTVGSPFADDVQRLPSVVFNANFVYQQSRYISSGANAQVPLAQRGSHDTSEISICVVDLDTRLVDDLRSCVVARTNVAFYLAFSPWKFCLPGQYCVQQVLQPTRNTGSLSASCSQTDIFFCACAKIRKKHVIVSCTYMWNLC